MLRSKGYFWIATRPEWVGELSQAGGALTHQAAGFWWASDAASEQWPDDPEALSNLREQWHPIYGDRRQELVVIGMNMDELALVERLDACLLTDAESARDMQRWQSSLDDPFPAWRLSA